MQAGDSLAHDEISAQESHRANVVLVGLGFLYFLLELIPGITGAYGYFIDEFYYVACSDHLALGYVDQPPLSIFILRFLRILMGDSLPALRILPALAGGATVVITGLIARRLGAGLFGQAIAAGCVMVSAIYFVFFSFYSMNSLSTVIWALCFLVLVDIERRKDPRLWLLFGVLAGLGLENKHTLVLLLLGLAVGLLLTRARRHLASRWLWLGAGIAVLLILPNVVWQMTHGWVSLEFYRNADIYKNIPTPPLEVLKQQVLFMNPGALVIWLAGLWFFLFSARGQPYRHLGWIYVTLLLLMLIAQKSRPDRIADVYPILFAGGGVVIGDLVQRPRLRWLRWALPVSLMLSGGMLAPLGLPLLPPENAAEYSATLGITPKLERGEGKVSELPQWLADRLGWEQLVDDVTAVVEQLDPVERDQAIIFAPSYGQAGAVELLGRGRNLPPVYAAQNTYHMWGPPEDPVEVAIILGPFSEESVRYVYDEVTIARIHDCEWCMSWRDQVPIFKARGQKVNFSELWPQMGHYE